MLSNLCGSMPQREKGGIRRGVSAGEIGLTRAGENSSSNKGHILTPAPR